MIAYTSLRILAQPIVAVPWALREKVLGTFPASCFTTRSALAGGAHEAAGVYNASRQRDGRVPACCHIREHPCCRIAQLGPRPWRQHSFWGAARPRPRPARLCAGIELGSRTPWSGGACRPPAATRRPTRGEQRSR